MLHLKLEQTSIAVVTSSMISNVVSDTLPLVYGHAYIPNACLGDETTWARTHSQAFDACDESSVTMFSNE